MDNRSDQEIIEPSRTQVTYHGGLFGAVLPFLVLVTGVVWLALSGAPDERGFWPILVLALTLGLLLARDRKGYCEVVIEGMARPILMIMIMAWTLASIIGVLMSATGFVDALIWAANSFQLQGVAFVIASFLICCLVSASTGTSFGTILVCGPLLYPAGGLLGADLATLAGAILGGATFGDSISPISDTTIASALSQKADIGGTVRSRLKYVIPAALLAMCAYFISASLSGTQTETAVIGSNGSPDGIPMMAVPIVIIWLLLSGRHLLHGLLAGLLVGTSIGLVLGLLPVGRLLTLDLENFTARSFVIEGIDRALGISVFTIFLLGLVAALQASGVLDRLVDFAARHTRGVRSAETWISGAAGGTVLLTCHSIVAILTVGEFARETGRRFDIHRYRRANLLDLTVSTFPFILPYFIPVILASSVTASGSDHGISPVSPLQVGLHNFHSFAVLLIIILAIATGFGRRFVPDHVGAPEGEVDERL